jgi:hypothetical protein
VSTQTKSPGIILDYVKTIGIVNNGFNGRGFANPYDIIADDDGQIFVLTAVTRLGLRHSHRYLQPG